MYNIRIKSLPENAKTGSQLNYALVDRNTLFIKPDMSVKQDVKKTESAVPREEAKIEAEGGEFHLSSTPDGYLKLMKILGNSHANGGVPLDANPGDYIYSQTPKLAIKDPEVLAMFGVGGKTPKSYTPAEIVNKYNNLNEYVDVLKDPKSDAVSKNTANLMLKNYIEKLGQVALLQEAKKGFPEGIPAIAEMAAANLQGGAPQQGEEEQVAKYGGTALQVYQTRGQVPAKTNNLPPNTKKKLLTKKKEEGFWDNRGMPSWSQVGHGIAETLNAGTKGETYLATGLNALAHTGSWSGGGKQDEKGHKYGAKYALPSELPHNAHLSRAAKIALDLAADPLNQITLGSALAETATAKIAKAGAEAAIALGEDMAKNTIKNKVAQETAEAVLTSAGKKITPRNIEIARGAVAKASQKGIKAAAGSAAQGAKVTKGAVAGARNAAIGYDTKNLVEVANAPFNLQYQALEKLHSLSGIPLKQIPGKIARGAVKAATAVKEGVNYKYAVPAINAIKSIANTAGTETVPEVTPEQKLNQTDVAAGLPAELTPYTSPTTVTPKPVVSNLAKSNSAEVNPETRNRIIEENKAMKQEKEAARVQELNNRAAYVAQQRAAAIAAQKSAGRSNAEPAPTPVSAPEPGAGGYRIVEKYGGYIGSYQNGSEVKPGGTKEFSPSRGMERTVYPDGTATEWTTPETVYNVADQPFTKAAEEAGYIIERNPKGHPQLTVPAQTRNTGFTLNPESGFYENAQYPIGKEGLQAYMEHWKEPIARYQSPKGDSGPEAWKRDLLAQKGEAGPASTHVADYADALAYMSTGKHQIDVHQKDVYKPGIDLFNLKKFTKKPDIPPPPPPGIIPPVKRPPVTPPVRNDWWLQDKINLAGIMGDRVRKFGPTMGHYDYRTPDYALEDPAMLNQLNLSAMGKYQEGLYGSTAGNIAGATAAANIGAGQEQAAVAQSQVQNRNVNTLNSVSAQAAQMANQAEQIRHGDRGQYAIDSAVAQQQYENARRNLKWQQIAALNNGITNYQARNEQLALTPNAFIHPDTGEVSVINPAQMFNQDYSLGYNPYGASASTGYDTDSWYDEYQKQGLTPADQERRVNSRLKAHGLYNTAIKGKKGASPYGYGAGSPYGMGYGAAAFNPYGDEETT